MRPAFKILGLLLAYPDDALIAGLPELRELIAEEVAFSKRTREALRQLAASLECAPLLELQERYVGLFDRTRSVSLHLFEHVHGDSRDRGQAMVSLSVAYLNSGWALSSQELPDYLPALCELWSVTDSQPARKILIDGSPVLQVIEQRLLRLASPYAAALSALVELSGASQAVASEASEETLAPDTLDQLDESWAEAPVTFGVGAAHDSCQVTAKADSVQLRRSKEGGALSLPIASRGGL